MVRLCGLWKKTSDRGTEYLSGNLGNGRLLVIPNEHKSGPNDPDYLLYIKEKQDFTVDEEQFK